MHDDDCAWASPDTAKTRGRFVRARFLNLGLVFKVHIDAS